MFNRTSKKEYSKGKILYCNERVKTGGEWKSKTRKIQIKMELSRERQINRKRVTKR